jgi:hypothetical protein
MTEIEQIAFEVVAEVDWHKVVKTMEHLGWTWYSTGNITPTQGDLMKAAMKYSVEALTKSKESGEYTTGSGGIHAAAYDGKRLKVWFELTSYDNMW